MLTSLKHYSLILIYKAPVLPKIFLSVDYVGHLWTSHCTPTLIGVAQSLNRSMPKTPRQQFESWMQSREGWHLSFSFLSVQITKVCQLWLILHFPRPGTQISCFAPTNFSWRQAAYVDSFCWAAVQQQADSSPLWLHKVQTSSHCQRESPVLTVCLYGCMHGYLTLYTVMSLSVLFNQGMAKNMSINTLKSIQNCGKYS